MFYFLYYTIRRSLYSAILVFLPGGALLQIIAIMVLTLISLMYITSVRPFVSYSQNMLEMTNEILLLIISYHLLLLTGAFPDASDSFSYNLGWSFIFFLCLILLVNILYLVITTISEFKRAKKAKKLKEQRRLKLRQFMLGVKANRGVKLFQNSNYC